jgi:hypothetical protein
MNTPATIARVILQVGVPLVTETLPKLLRGMADKLDPPLGQSRVAEVRREADEARAERQAREKKP